MRTCYVIYRLASLADLHWTEQVVKGMTKTNDMFCIPYNTPCVVSGTETQRILIVTMRRLAEATMMMVLDHKGHILYANSGLAKMLGHQLKILKTKDITAIMPQPYGLMHVKWLKVTTSNSACLPLRVTPHCECNLSVIGHERLPPHAYDVLMVTMHVHCVMQDIDHMNAKATPASCRNGVSAMLQSATGGLIPVKCIIAPHTTGGHNNEVTYSVKVCCMSKCAYQHGVA